MVTVKDIYEFINSIAPFETQEKWDNSGMLIGDISKEVKTVAVCLDITKDTIENAKINDADLIVSHHPVIFNPIKEVLKGDPVYELLQANLSAICAHTNLDVARSGVSEILAQTLELKDITILPCSDETDILRVGKIKKCNPIEFGKHVATKLNTTVRIAKGNKNIETVAVCGGSGCSFIPDILSANVDAFVTGDAKHNDFLDATHSELTLVAAGHYETENPTMPILAKRLKSEFSELGVIYIDSAPVEYITC